MSLEHPLINQSLYPFLPPLLGGLLLLLSLAALLLGGGLRLSLPPLLPLLPRPAAARLGGDLDLDTLLPEDALRARRRGGDLERDSEAARPRRTGGDRLREEE